MTGVVSTRGWCAADIAAMQSIASSVMAEHRMAAAARHAANPLAMAAQRTAPSLLQYRRLLAAHDWHYDRSDDYSKYAAGRAQRAQLVAMQREIDPEFATWNLCAPASWRRA